MYTLYCKIHERILLTSSLLSSLPRFFFTLQHWAAVVRGRLRQKSSKKRVAYIQKKRNISFASLSIWCYPSLHHSTVQCTFTHPYITCVGVWGYGHSRQKPFLPIDYQPLYFHVSFIFCRWLFEGGGGDVIYINLSFFRSLLSWSCISNSIEIKKDIKNNN